MGMALMLTGGWNASVPFVSLFLIVNPEVAGGMAGVPLALDAPMLPRRLKSSDSVVGVMGILQATVAAGTQGVNRDMTERTSSAIV